MNTTKTILSISLLLLLSKSHYGQENKLFLGALPSCQHDKFVQPIFYQGTDKDQTVNLSFRLIKENGEKDSQVLYNFSKSNYLLHQGITQDELEIKSSDKTTNKDFQTIVSKFELIPTGSYSLYTILVNSDKSDTIYNHWNIDSTLDKQSKLYGELNQSLLSELNSAESLKGISSISSLNPAQLKTYYNLVAHSLDKFKNTIHKQAGLDISSTIHKTTLVVDVFYQSWFLGRMEYPMGQPIQESVKSIVTKSKENLYGMIGSSMDDSRSLTSQFEKIRKTKKNDKVYANIGMTTYMGTGQEEYGQQKNNYVETQGNLRLKVCEIPIEINGFYTTQDIGRKQKASYFKISYDFTRAKEELGTTVDQYKSKYEETAGKAKGYTSIYSSYLNQLKSQKDGLSNTLLKERTSLDALNLGIKQDNSTLALNNLTQDTSLIKEALKKELTSSDTSQKVQRAQEQLKEKQEKLAKKKQQVENLERKIVELQKTIDKYEQIMHQYQQTQFMDSSRVYKNVQDLKNTKNGDLNYRSVYKSAEPLLDKTGLGKYTKGLTEFNAGIYNTFQSNYTNAGQTQKGVGVGYDFGFVKTSVNVGRTEYISRSGTLDKYTNYSASLTKAINTNHEISLIYYGYQPSKQAQFKEAFFNKLNASYPSFQNPVHIVSLDYKGNINKWINLETEGAVSYKKIARESSNPTKLTDNYATKTALELTPNKLPCSITAEYEKIGKHFENNTLAILQGGTERLGISTSVSLFSGYVQAKVQYHYLLQQNLMSVGKNNRYGFEIKTISKRYPNLQVSYKPFSTFRSYDDTLQIAQRPLYGESITGRLSYQFKNHGISHRYFLLYNRNHSTCDTSSYLISLWQTGYILTNKQSSFNVIFGYNNTPKLNQYQLDYTTGKSYFGSVGISKSISKRSTVNGDIDLSIKNKKMNRYGLAVGIQYQLPKLGMVLRSQVRTVNYRNDEMEWNNRFGGQLGLNWTMR